jgi:DnaK suppressor protein
MELVPMAAAQRSPLERDEEATMLDSAHLTLFRQRLTEERSRLTRTVAALDSEVHQLAQSEADEGSGVGNDPADVGSDVYEQERILTLERNEEETLRQVDEAMARLEAGTFGTCTRCGQLIGLERLEARPYAALCIRCQSAVEQMAGHR